MADVKWIKIVTDIFDDEKILLIESLPEADAIIVIWFKLLCLAGKNNNSGVFTLNDRIAYNEEMLATIFRRPLNTVRLALKTFEEYGMVEIVEGVITIPNWSKHQTLDLIESRRIYQREYMAKKREEQKLIAEGKNNIPKSETNSEPNSETTVNPIEGEGEREEEGDKEEEKDREKEIIEWSKFLIAWNDLPQPIKPIKSVTDRRKDKIKARINSMDLKNADILEAISNISKSSFLQGKNSRTWVIDFDWLFHDDNSFTKVLEGKYTDKEGENDGINRQDNRANEASPYDFSKYEGK